jgi:hypothetical protein
MDRMDIWMKTKSAVLLLALAAMFAAPACGQFTDRQLGNWLKRFPDADANGDGRLTTAEAKAYRQKMQSAKPTGGNRGAPRQFNVSPGWQADQFPQHAVCYKSPQEIAAIFAAAGRGNRDPITRYPKPGDGSLRIVATGHSFMAPGFKTFPVIAKAAGLDQPPLLTHTGGGITGSARYKWEQENGIFQFDRNPTPKLLASIANSKWDAMMWGPYFNDHPDYYACWIDFCLQYNPDMKFYLSDAWPQLDQLDKIPTSEDALTAEMFDRLGKEKYAIYSKVIHSLNEEYPGKVFVLPTCDAMVLAVEYYHRGELPGVEGIHAIVGKQQRSLWRDRLGHLGPGFDRLEGYVFYAAIYGRSPELISGAIPFHGPGDFPGPELDNAFRKIAWQAALRNPLTGVTDKNHNGIDDHRE